MGGGGRNKEDKRMDGGRGERGRKEGRVEGRRREEGMGGGREGLGEAEKESVKSEEEIVEGGEIRMEGSISIYPENLVRVIFESPITERNPPPKFSAKQKLIIYNKANNLVWILIMIMLQKTETEPIVRSIRTQ